MNLRVLCAVAALTVAGPFLASANAATIAEIVSESGGEFDGNKFDYDILLNAVVAADLVDALNDPNSDLTVFAPNDLAFIRLAHSLGYTGKDEEGAFNFIVEALASLDENGDPIPALTTVLLYHVAGERVNAFQFILRSIFNQPIDTLQGESFQPFFIFLLDNEDSLPNPTLFFPLNVNADGGIIHTISRVLIPDALLP